MTNLLRALSELRTRPRRPEPHAAVVPAAPEVMTFYTDTPHELSSFPGSFQVDDSIAHCREENFEQTLRLNIVQLVMPEFHPYHKPAAQFTRAVAERLRNGESLASVVKDIYGPQFTLKPAAEQKPQTIRKVTATPCPAFDPNAPDAALTMAEAYPDLLRSNDRVNAPSKNILHPSTSPWEVYTSSLIIDLLGYEASGVMCGSPKMQEERTRQARTMMAEICDDPSWLTTSTEKKIESFLDEASLEMRAKIWLKHIQFNPLHLMHATESLWPHVSGPLDHVRISPTQRCIRTHLLTLHPEPVAKFGVMPPSLAETVQESRSTASGAAIA